MALPGPWLEAKYALVHGEDGDGRSAAVQAKIHSFSCFSGHADAPALLARGRERYAKIPFRKRDDTAEMRKHVDPNWERVLPRW